MFKRHVFVFGSVQHHRVPETEIFGQPRQRLVDHLLELHWLAAAGAARLADDHLGAAQFDAVSDGAGREAGEDDHMDGADSGAGQHGADGFDTHRHIDGHPVALLHTDAPQGCGIFFHQVEQLDIGDGPDLARIAVLVDEDGFGAPAHPDLVVQAVVADVSSAAQEPFEGRVIVLEDFVPLPEPVDVMDGLIGRVLPETFVVFLCSFIKCRYVGWQHTRCFTFFHRCLSH